MLITCVTSFFHYFTSCIRKFENDFQFLDLIILSYLDLNSKPIGHGPTNLLTAPRHRMNTWYGNHFGWSSSWNEKYNNFCLYRTQSMTEISIPFSFGFIHYRLEISSFLTSWCNHFLLHSCPYAWEIIDTIHTFYLSYLIHFFARIGFSTYILKFFTLFIIPCSMTVSRTESGAPPNPPVP